MPRRRPRQAQTDSPTIEEELADVQSTNETSSVAEPSQETAASSIGDVEGTASTPMDETPKQRKPRASRSVSSKDVGTVETKEEPRPESPVVVQNRSEGVPNGIILEANDPLIIEGDDAGVEIIVSRDVYRKVYPYNSRRPTYVLVYARGTRVLKSLLQPVPKNK